jgi:arsenate reductase
MAVATIYHNPRCTKSRQAMGVVDELGVEVDVVRYLESPPDAATLRSIIAKLEDPPADLVRRDGWKELGSRPTTWRRPTAWSTCSCATRSCCSGRCW